MSKNDKEKKSTEVGLAVPGADSMPARGLPDSSMPVKKGVKDEKGKKLQPVPPKKYDAAGEIKKFGLQPTELLEYKDPFSGEMKRIMIDRRGTTDEKLALALLDDSVPRDQKDTMLSMYLFEQGKQGASMLMDLWAYKGQHTKESRAFQSTMRFDFELFLNAWEMFLHDSADMIFSRLPVEVVEIEAEVEDGGKKKKVKKEVVRVREGAQVDLTELLLVIGEMGRYQRMTATLLTKRIRAEVEKRERAKGKGIYIDLAGKPYSAYEDGDIVDAVKHDRETVENERHERDE